MHMFIALASKAKDEKGEMYAGAGGGRRTNSSSYLDKLAPTFRNSGYRRRSAVRPPPQGMVTAL